MRRLTRLLPALVAAAAAAACLGDDIPTVRVGGAQYGLPLANPGAGVVLPRGVISLKPATTVGSRIDTITIVLTNLKPLEGPARYQFWLVDGQTGANARPIAATHTLTRTDSAIGSAAGGVTTTRVRTALGLQQFYAGAPFNTIDTVKIATVPGTADSIGVLSSFVVVTIQPDSGSPAFVPATPKPLWFRFRNPRGTPAITDDSLFAGNTLFGQFNTAGVNQIYTVQGSGRSAFWDRAGSADNPRLVYRAIAFSVSTPPRGYYYQPWLRDSRSGRSVPFGVVTDTLGRSLFDADTVTVAATTAQLATIRFGTTEDSIGARFLDFTSVQLVLEPKAGVRRIGDVNVPNVIVALQGNIGDTLVNRRAAGQVRVTVRRAGAPLGGVTVVLAARDANFPYTAPKTTDAAGTALFGATAAEAIPAGDAVVKVYLAGASAEAASQTVVVRGRTEAERLRGDPLPTTEVVIDLP